ncbi:hypothetical protein SBOR_4150 [Sclerotinia borealis F-4128]|uniref:Uncharacterized protein n=1 Tax=Sclerotinia borealis (strain F-4128) TaxID=1432307 RepID=W9CI05_SCLBF|nr:hypothetical protein SBOR_4150 [Sclerotinia borealis F-4128]
MAIISSKENEYTCQDIEHLCSEDIEDLRFECEELKDICKSLARLNADDADATADCEGLVDIGIYLIEADAARGLPGTMVTSTAGSESADDVKENHYSKEDVEAWAASLDAILQGEDGKGHEKYYEY